MSGAYYVIGGFEGKKTKRVLPDLLNFFTCPPNLLYLGAACENDFGHQDSFKKGFLRNFPHGNWGSLSLYNDMRFNNDPDEGAAVVKKAFEAADIVFFEGGHVPLLKQVFSYHGLRKLCEDAVHNGKLVGGLCGGGAIFADSIVFTEGHDTYAIEGEKGIHDTTISCYVSDLKQDCERMRLLKDRAEQPSNTSIGIGANQVLLKPLWEEPYALDWGDENVPIQINSYGQPERMQTRRMVSHSL